MRARRTLSILGIAALIALTGCASSQAQPDVSEVVASVSPEPSTSPQTEEVPAPEVPRKPEFGELVITSSALGSLRVGSPVTESDMVVFTPDACYFEGGSPDDPENGRWLSTYSTEDELDFTVHVNADETVGYLNVKSEQLATDNGIHVGSTLEELLAAYPAAEMAYAGALSTVYSSTDEDGVLTFEVPTPEYWPEFGNRVVVIGILGPVVETIGPIVGGDGGAGSCF